MITSSLSSRTLRKTGASEVTLQWKPPKNLEGVQSYRIYVTYVDPSDDKLYMHEVQYDKARIIHAWQSSICMSTTLRLTKGHQFGQRSFQTQIDVKSTSLVVNERTAFQAVKEGSHAAR